MQRINVSKLLLFFVGVVGFLTLSASPILAKIGVGVATGKIVIDEILHPGTIYQLPPLTVVNTGDEPGEYNVQISYLEKQPELKPAESWFTFQPTSFHLEPGKSQAVAITLSLPLKVEPGKYFAYVEGHPAKVANNGQTSVGIAAAAKLYFQVAPANLLVGLYYRLITFWKLHHPVDTIIAGIVAAIALLSLLKSQFNFQVTKKSSKGSQDKNE